MRVGALVFAKIHSWPDLLRSELSNDLERARRFIKLTIGFNTKFEHTTFVLDNMPHIISHRFLGNFIKSSLKPALGYIVPEDKLVRNSSQLARLGKANIKNRAKLMTNTNSMMEWPKITLFGDSITRQSMDPDQGCWASFLSHAVGQFLDIDVRGFDGYNTKWALELMPSLFPKQYLDKVELIVIFFGHNDSWESELGICLTVHEYESNLKSIVNYLKREGLGNEKIILITPTWYDDKCVGKYLSRGVEFKPFKSFDNAKKYSEVVLQVAKDESIDVIDFFTISFNYQPLSELFYDGIHLSRTGAKLLFENLMPLVKRKIEAKYKTSLVNLHHVTPVFERPDFVEWVENVIKKTK